MGTQNDACNFNCYNMQDELDMTDDCFSKIIVHSLTENDTSLYNYNHVVRQQRVVTHKEILYIGKFSLLKNFIGTTNHKN